MELPGKKPKGKAKRRIIDEIKEDMRMHKRELGTRKRRVNNISAKIM